MKEVVLKAKRREVGKHNSKQVRNSGSVPGIYYIKGQDSIPITVEPKALRPIIYTSETKWINLQIEGINTTSECVIKDVSFHPITDEVVHFDLHGITGDKKMSFDIPIVLIGQPLGVREGGILQHNLRKITVHCFPKDMPTSIEINVADLHLGKSIHLKDILIPNVKFDLHEDTVVTSVAAPRVISKDKTEEQAALKTEPTA